MMEDYFEDNDVPERLGKVATRLRKSEAYPAILGALAGGIAGAVIALLISGMRSSKNPGSTAAAASSPKATARGGWSPRELLEFVTIGAALVKQVQEWQRERKKQ